MKRNQIIIIAIAAFLGLWMYSQSGDASTVLNDEAIKGDETISQIDAVPFSLV